MTHTIINSDCLEYLRSLQDNTFESVVTDPPYGLSFMGKKWDYDVPSVEIWRECLRVLKPGGHLLSFAGARTQHRMAVNIEDAGFDIRDMIAWVYGSGFPKSLDVSKAIDKKANELPVFDAIRAHIREWRDRKGYDNKALNEAAGSSTSGCGMARHWTSEEGGQHAIPSKDQWRKLKALLGWPDCEFDAIYDVVKDGAERPVIGRGTSDALAFYAERAPVVGYAITAPATDAARQWQGWGTALKPAIEPITLARKPLIGTVAENVQTYGTGALNIDGCRVGNEPITQHGRSGDTFGFTSAEPAGRAWIGRWPANFIHDGSEEVTELLPSTAPSKMASRGRGYGDGIFTNDCNYESTLRGFNDNGGSAARFFYCAKASKSDREEGNKHPTVKPTTLMRYLCRLITPPRGTILDPFMGSGSTGKAAKMEGFSFVGIEREKEYCEIAKKRIESAARYID